MDNFLNFEALTRSDVLPSHKEDAANGGIRNLVPLPIKRRIKPTHVSFVGAGPGDPELLTLKAVRALETADVIIYDRLVASEVLDLARQDAIFVDVGKTPGLKGWTQTEINEELVRQATDDTYVVRLKSGDPSLYGRLDEELEALNSAGIQYDIVPGITSALAAAASAQVSLTKRQRNSSVRFITGQDTEGYAEHDWQALSAKDSVSVMYMGRSASSFVQSRLLEHNADPSTPVTIVENASRANQRIVNATLNILSETIGEENINGPIIVFLGLKSSISQRDRLVIDDSIAQLLEANA